MEIAGYKIIETITNRPGRRVYGAEKDGEPFILKEFASHEAAGREYRVRSAVDAIHVPPCTDRFVHRGKTILVQERIIGETGGTYIERLETQTEKLAFAVSLTIALKAVHDAGIIHNDLSLANIFPGRDGCIRFTGFSRAIQNSSDPPIETGDFSHDRLRYIAPEKTTKVNEPVGRLTWRTLHRSGFPTTWSSLCRGVFSGWNGGYWMS